MDFNNIKESLLTLLTDGGFTLLKVFGIIILGTLIIKIILRVIKSYFKRSRIEKITQSFISSIIKFSLYIILILIIIQSLGIPITGFIAILSAAGLAIGLALQGSLSNLANGIIIISTKPFKKGDFVSIAGVDGTVHSIRMFTTTLVTPDGKTATLPNTTVVTNSTINYTAKGSRRVEFTIDVARECDIILAKKIVLEVIHSNGMVYLDPAPFCSLRTFKESSVAIFANCWCDSGDYWKVYYYVMDNVYNEFKKNKISIPYNQLEVRLREDEIVFPITKEPLPARIEKQRIEKKPDSSLENIHILEKTKSFFETLKTKREFSKKERKQLKKIENQERKLQERKIKILKAQLKHNEAKDASKKPLRVKPTHSKNTQKGNVFKFKKAKK